MKYTLHAIFFAILVSITAVSVDAQTVPIDFLKKYRADYKVTKLDWHLLQFNLRWHDSYQGEIDYVNSIPVVFDYYTRYAFYCGMRVQEKRYHNDIEPFSKLPKWKKKALLQGPIDHLIILLSNNFPEVKENPELLIVEYWFYIGDTGAVIARYENGTLKLLD